MKWLVSAGAIMALTACGIGLQTTYRYRMTVEVETPEGLRTGFAIREVRYNSSQIELPDSSGISIKQRGEAVAVDLSDGQTLFATMPVNGYEPLQAAFGDDSPSTLEAARASGRIVDLQQNPNRNPEQSGFPMLVSFRDLRDPESVVRVTGSDLAAVFGPGIKLKRVTLQMVEDAPNSGIGGRLKWLATHKGSLVYTGHLHPDHPEKDLTQAAFVQL